MKANTHLNASTERETARPSALRVASIPARHAYVDSVMPDARHIEPWVPTTPAGLQDDQWFPHPLLDATALRAVAQDLDLVHVHFGFEHRSVEQIRDFVAVCRQTGVALVVTVHDLENPHLTEQAEHLQRLRVLVEAAQRVITLTDSAAAQIQLRYGVAATVLAHPYVIHPPQAREILHQVSAQRTGNRVAVFLKDIRTNTVTDPGFYLDLQNHMQRGQLSVYAHHTAAEHPLTVALQNVLGQHLRLHERMTDHQLFATLAGFDAVVLPYTHGSHSGWLEMCRDLEVTVISPDTGHFAAQADQPEAVIPYRTADGVAAAQAADRALTLGRLTHAVDRAAQQAQVIQAHLEIYRQAVSGSSAPSVTEVSL